MIVDVHWIVRRDLPAIVRIERESYAYPWQEAEFLDALQQRNCIGVVARHRETVVGFAIYEARRHTIKIVNLAVATSMRRRRIGSQLVGFLKDKLSRDGRDQIVTFVGDDSLAAQLFLRQQGFRATAIVRNFYNQHDGDAYVMRYGLADSNPAFERHNRVSRYFDMEV